MGNCSSKDSTVSKSSSILGPPPPHSADSQQALVVPDYDSNTNTYSYNNANEHVNRAANNTHKSKNLHSKKSHRKNKKSGSSKALQSPPGPSSQPSPISDTPPISILPLGPYPTPNHELKWKILYQNYTTKIVDPADVHSILDECFDASIKKLHSAEMTLLSRRVRKVVRSLLASSNSNHNSSNYNSSNYNSKMSNCNSTFLSCSYSSSAYLSGDSNHTHNTASSSSYGSFYSSIYSSMYSLEGSSKKLKYSKSNGYGHGSQNGHGKHNGQSNKSNSSLVGSASCLPSSSHVKTHSRSNSHSNALSNLFSSSSTSISTKSTNGHHASHHHISSRSHAQSPSASYAEHQQRSKNIYQKEYVLDEFLMKQIFMGGHESLVTGSNERWADKSLDLYQKRKKRNLNRSSKRCTSGNAGGSASASGNTRGNTSDNASNDNNNGNNNGENGNGNSNGNCGNNLWGLVGSFNSNDGDMNNDSDDSNHDKKKNGKNNMSTRTISADSIIFDTKKELIERTTNTATVNTTAKASDNDTSYSYSAKEINRGNNNNNNHNDDVNNNDNKNNKSGKTSRKRKNGSRHSRWGANRHNNHKINSTHNNHNTHNNNKSSPPSPPSFVADIFGTAFHILLYLSEKRWDHVADIARLSAKNANLILDVNEQTRFMEKIKEDKISLGGAAATAAMNNKDFNHYDYHCYKEEMSNSSSTSIPLPPPEHPSTETYQDLPPTPPSLPNGITLQEISFIVATALRSSRQKRLLLLFHLLLQPQTLIDLLGSHPAGGLPTWLLEVDNDWILSYASLGHYYYYGGKPSCSPGMTTNSSTGTYSKRNGGNGNRTSSCTNNNHKSAKINSGNNNTHSDSLNGLFSSETQQQQLDPIKELKIERLTAIETIAVLLHYVPQKSLLDDNDDNNNAVNNDKKTATAVGKKNITPLNRPHRERTLSYGDKKYHAAKMHVMLADYLRKLQQNAGEAPLFENEVEQFWRLETLDTFWDASHSQYSKCKEQIQRRQNIIPHDGQDSMMLWTLEEFVSWADIAIPDDSSLDLILHQLFGLGLLPTPAMERKLVSESWIDWQMKDSRFFYDNVNNEFNNTISIMTLGIKNLLSFSPREVDLSHSGHYGDDELGSLPSDGSAVWGGIGGFDGRGGLGNGVMYCIDKEWWDQWLSFVGWEWSDGTVEYASRQRPHDLSTEKLLDQDPDSIIRGTMGSYELMKKGLKKDIDYVLVPPRVWDILYELYGGGPPLPRMIMRMEVNKPIADNASIDIASHEQLMEKPWKVPRLLNVVIHPWVIECRVCDPHQPYRRGDVGPMSIRIMVTSQQPFWRLFAEIVLRLPIIHPRGKNSKGKGCARLWKKIEKEEVTDKKTSGVTRYGPWDLLQKRGSAAFPVGENLNIDSETYDSFQQSWESYADTCTIESIGLCDGDKLMFEYALVGKDGNFTWPREAAAKMGKLQRDNDEENLFRRKLRGLDARGDLVKNTKLLVGTVIDAMDLSGRWYQAEITDIDTSSKQSTDTESDDDTDSSDIEERHTNAYLSGEVKAIRVDFSDVGGEEEWIDVNSDRLAAHKRFTLDSMKSVDQLDSGKTSNEANGSSKPSSLIVLRKHNTKQPSTFQLHTSICSYPGFGACGLYNLGNTCYANSALQCITYMPLLRSYLLSGQFRRNGDLNRDNPLGTQGKVLEEFAELLRCMWSGKTGATQPLKFRSSLVRAKRRYNGTEQQDSQELLNDMLDMLHEDSNKVVKKPHVEALEDAWVDKTNLSRVGEETWRRYLRRNRSIIANICMGQVLNRVTCPSCDHTSRIFEPFNMLSLPFPNVTEVLFRCIVVRRASALNCTKTFKKFSDKKKRPLKPPSKQLIAEEYIIPMSRVADISELKVQLVKLCGIDKERLKLYTVMNGDVDSIAMNENLSLSLIQDEKNGPCWHFSQTDKSDEATDSTSSIVAYETTLYPRPEEDESRCKGYQSPGRGDASESPEMNRVIENILNVYGDETECLMFDTNPLPLAKAMSRILWPRSAFDLTVGLRVDAIDHKSHWFPGTVVEVIRTENGGGKSTKTMKMKVKVHFDNFSKKWDLTYSLDDIRAGKVQTLHSHSQPKDKPLEIQIFHSQNYDPLNLFSFPFFTHCHIEWSNARAGAHILTQASRYLEGEPQIILAEDEKNTRSFLNNTPKDSEVYRKLKESQSAIAKAIDVLIDADKAYINLILCGPQKNGSDSVAAISSKLERKMAQLMPSMPFEIMIYDIAARDDTSVSRTIPFGFKLDRTIGNCMNARQEIIICWKKVKNRTSFFSPPQLINHQQSKEFLEKRQDHIKKMNGGNAQNGMQLRSCLDEFCNEQQLDESECWRCPKCKELREGRQRMNLWRLPDILTFHLKRFNCSAQWREKITNKVNFPLTGLDMSEWCDKQSPALQGSDDNCVYDLIGVVNHYGGMTSGHYIAVSKATACSPEGSEEVEHYFNGAGVHAFGGTDEKEVQPALWKLIRNKEKDATNLQSRAAQASAKSAAKSSEPLWLQFDDESVEPIPPSEVVSQTAYVLFYRRRRITPSNIAKYSTIE